MKKFIQAILVEPIYNNHDCQIKWEERKYIDEIL